MKVELTAQDEVIVTELRPMSEAPRNGRVILAFNSAFNDFETVYYSDYLKCFIRNPGDIPAHNKLIGWMPLPTYKPK